MDLQLYSVSKSTDSLKCFTALVTFRDTFIHCRQHVSCHLHIMNGNHLHVHLHTKGHAFRSYKGFSIIKKKKKPQLNRHKTQDFKVSKRAVNLNVTLKQPPFTPTHRYKTSICYITLGVCLQNTIKYNIYNPLAFLIHIHSDAKPKP